MATSLRTHPLHVLRCLFFVLVLAHPALADIGSLTQCLQRSIADNSGVFTSSDGSIVSNTSNPTGFTYDSCRMLCGGGSESFNWTNFSQQFGAWLLPYLALVSQLPFGSAHRWGNITSVFLALGSPALAGYSLVLTMLNGRWAADRFARAGFPNAEHAAKVLGSLQQAPLRLTSDEGLLASLIVLPENDLWWRELADALDYTNTWSIAALAQIAWVIIAFVLTVAQGFSDAENNLDTNGQGVGSVFLWLIPIVGGWLQLSPKCDTEHLRKAFSKTHKLPYIATNTRMPRPASELSEERAMSIAMHVSTLLHYEWLSAPIFNYARHLPWMQCVVEISSRYQAAAEHVLRHAPVDVTRPWELNPLAQTSNREGTLEEVVQYTRPPHSQHSTWRFGAFRRMALAAVCGLALLWGTTGSAIAVVYYTPTVGLSCRSATYLAYGIVGTIVMFLMIASSVVAHYANPDSHLTQITKTTQSSRRGAALLAVLLRRVGMLLAMLNTLCIISICLAQFANVLDDCKCNSNLLSSTPYVVLLPSSGDLAEMVHAWGISLAFATGSCLLFWLLIVLVRDPAYDAWFGV